MKKNFTFSAFATMMLLGMSSVFYACSSDDDSVNQQEAGDKAVAALKDLVYDQEGNVIFGEAETLGIYEIGFDEKENATKLVGQYLNNANYKGGNAVYNVTDNRGKVSVKEGTEDGVFYEVEFAVKGIPTMTLMVEETNFMMGKENKMLANRYWKCTREGCTQPTMKQPKDITTAPTCTNCKKSDLVKPIS